MDTPTMTRTVQISANPLGLSEGSVIPSIQGLNICLANTYTMFHQVKKHHWLVEGPGYLSLHKFLDEWADSLRKDGDLIAERITALGGYPVSSPTAQEKLAVFDMEPEEVFGLREMLEKDLADGGLMAEAMRAHLREAAEVGDYGTEHLLKGILLAHEQMVHHVEHFLEPQSL